MKTVGANPTVNISYKQLKDMALGHRSSEAKIQRQLQSRRGELGAEDVVGFRDDLTIPIRR